MDQKEMGKMFMLEMFKQVEKETNMCFDICVPKPSSSLSFSEKSCVQNCNARFYDAMEVITERLREQAEKGQYGGAM